MLIENEKCRNRDYVTQVKGILYPEGFKNCMIGSKVTVVLPERADFAY